MSTITPEQQQQANAFIQQLLATAPKGQRLYAIIDGAQDDAIFPRFTRKADVFMSLYNNDVPDVLKAAGPILYQMKADDELSAWLIDQGKNNNWFILFASLGITMADIRRHFKRFAMVEAPNGKHMYFRYYDPRVLRTYLGSVDDDERQYVFGRFPCFWAQDSEQDVYLQFDQQGDCTRISLDT